MSVYKPCDIRGNAATELSPSLYESWGQTLGRQLGPGAKIVVGGDVRGSTPPFLAALIDGLLQAGMDVTDLGLLPTPMIYYAKHQRQAVGCAIVTASHNPAAINGLKWMLGDRPPTPEDVAALERSVIETTTSNGIRTQGALRTVDISSDYIAWLQETFKESSMAQLNVIVDPMRGCWAERARRYLQAVFPRCVFSTIRDTPDTEFGGCTPDCSRPRELLDLCATISRQRAHLGIAFDGDGDRIGLVDDKGAALTAEEATWVLLHSFDQQLRGSRFVYDLKFSDRVPEASRQLGAEPLVERSGHAFIRTRMCETGSLFGAEISGHFFYRALGGGDDGLYTACRLIAYLSRSDRTLADLRRDCPPIYTTPDLRVSVAPCVQLEIIAQVRTAWAQFPQETIDGVRINTPNGWALVRSSVTEPALTFRFEGRNWLALEDLVKRFCDTLPKLGEELYSQYALMMKAKKQ